MSKEYKFRASSKYFTISSYVFSVLLVLAIAIKCIFFWDDASAFISNLISTLEPFFLGILIAFLINPLVNWMRRFLFGKLIPIKRPGVNNGISIALSYILVLAAIIGAIFFIIPSVIKTAYDLVKQIDSVKDTALGLAKWVDAKIDIGLTATFTKYLSMDYLKSLVADYSKDITSSIISTGSAVLGAVVNIVIAFIVSIYLIIDKKVQTRSFKRIIYAFFSEKRAKKICYVGKKAVTIFSNFFDGKMLDSLIMGIITFVALEIMGLCGLKGCATNALLIAILIGVTNMIPYFGPFIGAVPSILFLLVYSWTSAIVFTIYIIVIMQVDGNIIGPKILGGSTGLRPLWIIFSITIGGWAFGVVGMLIGVPIVATITGLLNESVDERLDKKGIDMPQLDKPAEPKEQKVD
ncbi:MAG: AI-2E family transporter [Eubacterium sp.]|nr:AI-2E family transporter [Eubacterium sp.]